MRELYVYYRVPNDAAAAATREVAALHDEVRAAWPGLEARLLRRPESSAGQQTWMEIYVRAPAGVDAAVQGDIEARAARLLTHLSGPRHIEVFLACAS
jgi:hypothetical protein